MSVRNTGQTSPRNTCFLPGSRYDVFLSFRGEDTRTNFTDHLYTALVKKGIHTFRDDEELERGERISQKLEQAIEESGVFILIFSENYANSKWCLNELVKIMECQESEGRKVFSIFYHVDPSHVRNQSGKYEAAFEQYENDASLDREQIDKWRAALREAGGRSGYHIENQYETEILKKITTETLCEIIGKQCAEDGLVCKKSQLDGLKELISERRDCLMVGICGLDGVGKTTIARALYDEIACQFDGASFLANVGDVSEKDGLYCLQKQLLCDILLGGENQETLLIHRSNNCLKEKLRDKRVLIVLDDVRDIKQLRVLAGGRDWFGQGSRIIITAKNKHLLYQHGVRQFYEPKGFNTREALDLFSYHADTKQDSLYNFYPLSKQVISYCNHHPLALQVLGSFLRGKSYLQWQVQLDDMARESARENMDILRVSYNGLNHQEQYIFLDVACFFKGVCKDFVTKMMDGRDHISAEERVKVLTDKCLITESERKLWMQNVIQELGRKIVREAGKPCRFWDHTDIQRLLRTAKGLHEVEGISLDLSKSNHMHFPTEVFAKMTELKLLKVFLGCDITDGRKNYQVKISEDFRLPCFGLRYLHWHGYRLKLFPPKFEAVELLELSMPYSHLRQIGNKINFPQLTILNLSHSQHLKNISNFSRMPNLERLVLEGCRSLIDVDQSVGDLNNLSLMNLKDCKKLSRLPNRMCKLKSLITLILTGCWGVEKLPDELEGLQSLERLKADGTSIRSINNPPPNLRILHLGHCKRLQRISKLPSSILQVDAYNCTSLETSFWTTELGFLQRIQPERRKSKSSHAIIFKSARNSEFSILIPGDEIPDCFIHKSEGSSVRMELPNPDWYDDNFLGFAVCIVLAPKAKAEMPQLNPEILCEVNNFRFFYSCGEDSTVNEVDDSDKVYGGNIRHLVWFYQPRAQAERCRNIRDHVWFAYQPRARAERCRPKEWNQIEASFEVFDYEVKKCAIHLIYKLREQQIPREKWNL